MKRTDWIKRASGLFVPPTLRWSPGYPCCCGGGTDCTNGACQGGTAPATLVVTLDGITNDLCDACEALNDTFILSKEGEYCNWKHIWEADVCSETCHCRAGSVVLGLYVEGTAPNITRSIYVYGGTVSSGFCDTARFVLQQTGQSQPWNCAAFDDLEIPPAMQTEDKCCSTSGATCHVSSP